MLQEKLRIAIISAHSCPIANPGTRDTGGMNVYIRELTRELSRAGHRVDIYTRMHNQAEDAVAEISPNSRLIHLPAGPDSIDKLSLFSYMPELAANLEEFRRSHNLNYDLIFSHYWLSGIAGDLLQKQWYVPHLMMFHTLGAIKNAIGIGETEPELRVATEKQLITRSDRIIAATTREKNDIIHYYDAAAKKISVIPCGVNMALFRPIDRQQARKRVGLTDDKIILFVGRFDPLKGLDQLIRAMAYLPDTRLVIVGGDEQDQLEKLRLQTLCRELNIENSVTFQGLVKYEEMPYFYNAASVCVVPSYYESFGLVTLESLACGTPVVATDIGNVRNIIRQGETGYVVDSNQPEVLANRINSLLERLDINIDYSYRIRDSVSRYGWENITRDLLKAFHEEITRYPVNVR